MSRISPHYYKKKRWVPERLFLWFAIPLAKPYVAPPTTDKSKEELPDLWLDEYVPLETATGTKPYKDMRWFARR